jgi:hypothetical protein
MDMKNRTLQGGDSYPSCLAGIKRDQLKSCQFRSKLVCFRETDIIQVED